MGDPVEQPAAPMAQLFSGDYTYPVEEFLVLVDTNTTPHKCFYAHTPHKTAYVANALTGRARLWYVRWAAMREHKAPVYNERGSSFNTAWKAYKDKHYEMFRRDLVAEFGIPETFILNTEFRHLTQNRTSVERYADRWARLAERCKENLDSEYNRLWFIHGLRPQIRGHMLQVFPFHLSFAKVVAEAKAMEESLDVPLNIDRLGLSQALGQAVSQAISHAMSQAVSQAVAEAVQEVQVQQVQQARQAHRAQRASDPTSCFSKATERTPPLRPIPATPESD